MKDIERLIEVAEAHGIAIKTVQAGELDLATSAGRMVARILGSVARQESEHKSERQRLANKQHAEAGREQTFWLHANGGVGRRRGGVGAAGRGRRLEGQERSADRT
jgi:site-specific DNA recombinase